MFSTMKIAAVALLSLTSMAYAAPGSPPKYGDTTTSSSSSTEKSATTPTKSTSCWTSVKTSHSTGVTTISSYKPITTWVPTTYKTDVPRTYTEKDHTRVTGVTTITKPVTKGFTSTSVGYSTSDEVKTVTYTQTGVSTTTIVKTIPYANVRSSTTTIKHSAPFTSVHTGVSTGIDTITKPYTRWSDVVVTKTRNGHSQVVTSVPKVTSSLCVTTKPFSTDIVTTEAKCTTKKGSGW